MALSWSAKRQLTVLGIVVIALLFLAALPVGVFLFQPATCSDGKQNQDEQGVDCGGSCPALCQAQIRDLEVKWARAFKAGETSYDIVAFVENRNAQAGSLEVPYTFQVYDSENILISEIPGTTFVNPGEEFILFERGVTFGSGRRIPARVFVDFDVEDAFWQRSARDIRDIDVSDISYEPRETNPRVRATLSNQSLDTIQDISIVAVALDDGGNAVSVSTTILDSLPKNGSRVATFLFPNPFEVEPQRFRIYPRIDPLSNDVLAE